MKAKAKKPQPRRQAKRKPGQQPHIPTHQTLATVRAMAGVGYSQAIIARHIGVSEPTLRAHYRELLDNACEATCAHVFANLCRIATTRMDHAAVQAGRFILSCRAGWRETSRVEVDDPGRGITAVLRIIDEARKSPDYAEPDIDVLRAQAADYNPASARPN